MPNSQVWTHKKVAGKGPLMEKARFWPLVPIQQTFTETLGRARLSAGRQAGVGDEKET